MKNFVFNTTPSIHLQTGGAAHIADIEGPARGFGSRVHPGHALSNNAEISHHAHLLRLFIPGFRRPAAGWEDWRQAVPGSDNNSCGAPGLPTQLPALHRAWLLLLLPARSGSAGRKKNDLSWPSKAWAAGRPTCPEPGSWPAYGRFPADKRRYCRPSRQSYWPQF